MPAQIELHGKSFSRFISAEEIDGRISKLAVELTAALLRGISGVPGKPPLFIGILNGAVMFHADLIRACDFELEVSYLRTRSYSGMKSSGKVEIDWPIDLDLSNRHVVIVEDIVDSGLTLSTLTSEFKQRGAAAIVTVVLLDKPMARSTPFIPDFVGFEIPDSFVVGYGLDFNGIGRNLPSIYQVDEE